MKFFCFGKAKQDKTKQNDRIHGFSAVDIDTIQCLCSSECAYSNAK